VLIESVHRKDVLFLVAIAAHTAELATAKLIVKFLSKWVWVFSKHKGNKSDSSAIRKKPWAYRIGTPQDLLSLVALSAHTAELATAKPLVEFVIKFV
jgi:hypothetical protein